MKKFTIMALAVCLTFVMAAPVMAVDADFSGAYRVRGSYVSDWDLSDKSESNAFMNMRFRLQTVFKASDILSVTVRFDALDDHVWGTADDTSTGAGNIDFDRAYMTIKAPVGTFAIGRMAGGAFGTKFVDSESNYDRIKYTKVMDNLTIMATFEKVSSTDEVITTDAAADADSDKYILAAIQKMENLTVGILGAFINDKTSGSISSTASQYTIRKYALNPYVVGKFGPIGIQGEVSYTWGDKDFDAAATTDIDYKLLAYNIEASYNLGPASIMAGYAFVSGDSNGTSVDHEDSAAGGVGNDWEKLFILTTNEVPALVQLGNYGNLSTAGVANTTGGTNKAGAKIIYGGATFSPLDNLKLGVIIGNADADEALAGWKDDYGLEYDFTLNWKIYDNLTYNAIAAFLEAGDYFYQGATKPANFDDTYALFHQLQLSF